MFQYPKAMFAIAFAQVFNFWLSWGENRGMLPLFAKEPQINMKYHVIFDGKCNLCTTLVQLLETLDKGQLFDYIPMQDEAALKNFEVTPQDCEMGMILIDASSPERRWQGSDAAEEIGRLLPAGDIFVSAYRGLPGMKWIGDRVYEQVRDNRYSWFGKRSSTYKSAYPVGCNATDNCQS